MTENAKVDGIQDIFDETDALQNPLGNAPPGGDQDLDEQGRLRGLPQLHEKLEAESGPSINELSDLALAPRAVTDTAQPVLDRDCGTFFAGE